MPRPIPPPTPSSSSDLRGKDTGGVSPTSLALPPTAYKEHDRASVSSATPSAAGSDSSYRPMSPGFVQESARKRPAVNDGPVITKEDFTLPPPPTRSRKIIQMKPRAVAPSQPDSTANATTITPSGSKSGGGNATGGKKKQGGANTTAAGRKIARKTAHSLIERRRRSKMNEEFGVLKDLIPACKGQEMHKLAILQASIEYLRYLEQCIADLQAKNNSSTRIRLPPMTHQVNEAADHEDEDMEDDDAVEVEVEAEEGDEEEEAGASTPATRPLEHTASGISLPSLSQITSVQTASPSIFSSEPCRQYSISSASQASYSPYFHSTQTSPAFGPQLSHAGIPTSFSNTFGLGSPALKPVDSLQTLRDASAHIAEKHRSIAANPGRTDRELDQEATAALLMLNHDRRNWRPGGFAAAEPPTKRPRNESSARSSHSSSPVEVANQNYAGVARAHRSSNAGMSVRDLLSG